MVSPLAIVTVPDCESTSEPVASSTVPSLSLPMTLYVSVVSAVTAAFAVTVYVIALPSATLVALAEREYPVAPEAIPVPEIVPPEPSEIVEPVGNDATPISAARAAYVLLDPVTPDVSFPPTSKVNLSAPFTVMTAPLESVN